MQQNDNKAQPNLTYHFHKKFACWMSKTEKKSDFFYYIINILFSQTHTECIALLELVLNVLTLADLEVFFILSELQYMN